MAESTSTGWTPARSAAGNHSPWVVASVISIPTFMEVLDVSIANVALRHVAGALSASYDEATWVLTSYLVSNAIIIPMSGWLSETLGRKRYYMISVAVFAIASFLCGLSPSLGFLIAARIVQGLAGGGLQPTTQSILVDTFPPEKRGQALALFGVTAILAPAVGPVLGGFITDHASWRWVFLINIPVGLLSLFLVKTLITEPEQLKKERDQKRRRGLTIDAFGVLFIAGGLGALEVTMDRGQREDWFASPMICTAAVLAVVLLVAFVIRELTARDPLLDLRMFKSRNFSISMVIILVVGVIIFGTTQFLPQLLQEVLQYTATDAGLALTAGGVVTLMAMPVAGILTDKVPPKYLVGFGLLVEIFALWSMTHLNADISFHTASMTRVWLAIGIPFLFLPLTNAAYIGLKPNQSNQASALMNIGRNLGGTIGISLIQAQLAQRQQYHQARYVESLNPLNPDYQHNLQGIVRGLMHQGLGASDAMQVAVAQIYKTLLRQAQMLAFIDAFRTLMIFIAVVSPLVLFMKSNKPSAPKKEGASDAAPEGAH
jgi:DHA2 family multidrug resistance protein